MFGCCWLLVYEYVMLLCVDCNCFELVGVVNWWCWWLVLVVVVKVFCVVIVEECECEWCL